MARGPQTRDSNTYIDDDRDSGLDPAGVAVTFSDLPTETGSMVTQPEDFDVQVVRNCPAGAKYYFLFRFGRRNEQARYPAKGTLRIYPPFEHPIDCSPGTWLVAYCSDHRGLTPVQLTGHRPHVEVELWVPPAVIEGANESSQATERAQRPAQQSTELRGADPAQVDALLRTPTLAADMMEKHLALAEKLQDAIKRIAEIESSLSQRIASPMLAPDYTPVLQSIVAAGRDIGVPAKSREDGR
jgi:hypothetical protein